MFSFCWNQSRWSTHWFIFCGYSLWWSSKFCPHLFLSYRIFLWYPTRGEMRPYFGHIVWRGAKRKKMLKFSCITFGNYKPTGKCRGRALGNSTENIQNWDFCVTIKKTSKIVLNKEDRKKKKEWNRQKHLRVLADLGRVCVKRTTEYD